VEAGALLRDTGSFDKIRAAINPPPFKTPYIDTPGKLSMRGPSRNPDQYPGIDPKRVKAHRRRLLAKDDKEGLRKFNELFGYRAVVNTTLKTRARTKTPGDIEKEIEKLILASEAEDAYAQAQGGAETGADKKTAQGGARTMSDEDIIKWSEHMYDNSALDRGVNSGYANLDAWDQTIYDKMPSPYLKPAPLDPKGTRLRPYQRPPQGSSDAVIELCYEEHRQRRLHDSARIDAYRRLELDTAELVAQQNRGKKKKETQAQYKKRHETEETEEREKERSIADQEQADYDEAVTRSTNLSLSLPLQSTLGDSSKKASKQPKESSTKTSKSAGTEKTTAKPTLQDPIRKKADKKEPTPPTSRSSSDNEEDEDSDSASSTASSVVAAVESWLVYANLRRLEQCKVHDFRKHPDHKRIEKGSRRDKILCALAKGPRVTQAELQLWQDTYDWVDDKSLVYGLPDPSGVPSE
jgi:hypothetical protein